MDQWCTVVNVQHGVFRLGVELTGSFAEGTSGEMRFEDITGEILERVIQYLHYKVCKTSEHIAYKEIDKHPCQTWQPC